MEINLVCGKAGATVDTMGGELFSYRDEKGLEYLWQGDAASWPGRSPHLFPVIGSLKNGSVRAQGKICRLHKHGFAQEAEFAARQSAPDRVCLLLEDSERTREAYPFAFRLAVEHILAPKGFTTDYTVENPGRDTLWFCLGGHIGFRCPLRAGETMEDYELEFETGERCPTLLHTDQGLIDPVHTAPLLSGRTLPLRHALFDHDSLILSGLVSRSVRLGRRGQKDGVRVRFPDFPVLGLWTMAGKNAPYLCIEPWHGMPDWADADGEFAKKPHAVALAPGGRFRLSLAVEILDG